MNLSNIILRSFRLHIFLFLILVGTISNAHADDFFSAITGGKPSIDIRLRYENAEQENALHDADALTVRTRLGYGTGDFYDFKAYIEAENVVDIIDDYNSTKNGNTQYSIVADPDETELNQFLLSYTGFQDTEIKLGRQRIKLDNDRFIGNVGWRQLEQTYDAVFIKNSSIPDTVVTYIYINGVKNIFSDDIDVDAHLLNMTYMGWGMGTLTGYGYFLEFNDTPESSQETFGVRFNGSRQINNIKILYTAEYARQGDYKSGNSGIDGDYLLLEAGAIMKPVTVKLGNEKLGGDSFSGFETPLATKHAFNGWADQFLGTPAAGLEDVYLSIGGDIHGISVTGIYHDFSSDSGSIDYGSEIDLSAVKKFCKQFSAGLKYADYNADSFGVDTKKLWLWVQFQL